MKWILTLTLALAPTLACSDSTGVRNSDQIVTVDGALTMTVSDQPASPGILWALPNVTTSVGALTVEQTQYGSLCADDVTGHADVAPGAIALTVRFSERLTICTQDVRALTYNARLTGLAGGYDLTVIRLEGTRADTLVRQRVTVP